MNIMITHIEKFNLYISNIICGIAYYLGLNTRLFYKYDYNLISASFKRKRRERKLAYNTSLE